MTRLVTLGAAVIVLASCSDDGLAQSPDDGGGSTSAGTPSTASQGESLDTGPGSAPGSGGSEGPDATTDDVDGTADDTADTGGEPADTVIVHLVPQAGRGGLQRINFAVPLWPGGLTDAGLVQVFAGGTELPSYRRVLASHADGSIRSLQIQVELEIDGETDLTIGFGAPAVGDLDAVAVEDTLVVPDGTEGPRVWALLPADWLSESGVAGPQIPATDAVATAWADKCDYDEWGIDPFLAEQAEAGSWLYDRGTALYRGYARTGELVPLSAAYRETAIYVSGSSGSGADVQIPVPGAADDLKYHYAQHAAIHYLLSGDDRYREFAESIAMRAHELFPDPSYDVDTGFWTERHAGFALLAYVWAEIVSDDQADTFAGWSDTAVEAYVAVQDGFPPGYDDADARCFAHEAAAHAEDYGYVGCSPWMSAILADGLDAWARERDDVQAELATNSIVELGRIVARDGLDDDGRPFYWMGVGTDADEVDAYEEHWGESAYVVAMAWHYDGRRDAALRGAADGLVQGFAELGEIGQLRSFNWQCRSAVATPWYLE